MKDSAFLSFFFFNQKMYINFDQQGQLAHPYRGRGDKLDDLNISGSRDAVMIKHMTCSDAFVAAVVD